MSHSITLVITYAIVCVLWWGVSQVLPLWREVNRPSFSRPWTEVGLVLLAAIAVLLLGQLWLRGFRLHGSGAGHVAAETLNQLIIFSPIIILPMIRRQGWASAWIQRDRLWARFAVGVGLALIALLSFSLFERGAPSWWKTIVAVLRPGNAHLAVQVLLEDVAIAVFFVRLSAALGPRWAIPLVAGLFAVGHLPTLIANGASTLELLELVRDFGLGILVVGTAWRGADIVWLWPVHFSLDMTQFVGHSS